MQKKRGVLGCRTKTATDDKSRDKSMPREKLNALKYFLPEFSRIFHLDGASVANEMAIPFEELYPFLRVEG